MKIVICYNKNKTSNVWQHYYDDINLCTNKLTRKCINYYRQNNNRYVKLRIDKNKLYSHLSYKCCYSRKKILIKSPNHKLVIVFVYPIHN